LWKAVLTDLNNFIIVEAI